MKLAKLEVTKEQKSQNTNPKLTKPKLKRNARPKTIR